MSTKKPIVQIVLTEKYYKKLKKLANDEQHSASNQGGRIIEKWIDDYEAAHGTIQIASTDDTADNKKS